MQFMIAQQWCDGTGGWCGTVLSPEPPPRSDPHARARATLESGEHYLVPAAVVIPQQDGQRLRAFTLWQSWCPRTREEPAETIWMRW